ncbi:SAM-dependent methyltransferase [Rhodobacter capsulatus]|uniref:class I SAM-dependent methyltransferase n=1 Tax=Rhodobacter capsulatus TaxID=1061 RepID=UPI0006DCDF55|nr:SAM-dependent methyltransferase [Rhodobacter capsulatus]KQB15484.1 ATP synthase subunit beta [Rhodobacter capsulatus]KQB16916.1 ATP synthase subunit beta [Rhodobacter capsulatus]PZX28326.1 SAM-dependent MidA family methyltransferase [Rhodobacter capsulatus]QNR62615.1 SAM-dependent methyltransferase [Rhodobacter capsulatus]
MTPLARLLAARIAAEGPIGLDRYMAECLLHPEHGYYATRDPFGRAGDFITAPEISQMFGEMLGLCLAQVWLDQGRPAPFILAEIGPGRGTLMADVARVIRSVPGMAEAARLHLIEASPALRAVQRKTLAAHQVTWHDSVETLPEAPLFLLANEFFDALPIRQFQRTEAGWAERQVGLQGERLVPGLAPPTRFAALEHRLADTCPGDVVETCPAAAPILGEIARRIAAHGGAALVIDYGHWRSLGDTFQAVRAHEYCDPFAAPGAADLTAHVAFEPLAEAARAAGAQASAMTPQGVLLERLGIAARAEALAAKLSGATREAHLAAHRRLTHPEEMGQVFQSLAIFPATAPVPPGFDV